MGSSLEEYKVGDEFTLTSHIQNRVQFRNDRMVAQSRNRTQTTGYTAAFLQGTDFGQE